MPGDDARLAADQLLGQFHLEKWAEASVYALSEGMAQRLMVARSILHKPDILFLDEPTAGLDLQSRMALWRSSPPCTRRARPVTAAERNGFSVQELSVAEPPWKPSSST
jgi:ABC-type molybdenum transport system ATPase subunit/photorepair protein PhrA